MAAHSEQSFRDDFERFCTTAAVEVVLSPRAGGGGNRPLGGGGGGDFDCEDGVHENPAAWLSRYNVEHDRLTKDVLFDTVDMKYIVLSQYGADHQPEYIKWKLFGYNLVICFEYIYKGKTDKALEIINEMKNQLESIGNNDTFLSSIRIALNHVTFSMKAHIYKLCGLESQMERFVLPKNMNNVNKAGLFGIQALFFYEYESLCCQISKECALKASSINGNESEWFFLLARILRNWSKPNCNFGCCEEEFQASKNAFEIGNKIHHKAHLSSVYLRMSKNKKINEDIRNQYIDTAMNLLDEVIDETNDLILLKYNLFALTKNYVNFIDNYLRIVEKLINKLETSNNGFVHGVIGHHYLYNKKDYVKALFHLKKAYDGKSFGCSIDYIYTMHKMNPSTAPVEPLLVELLKRFPHPIHQEKILSQIISYLLITKGDLIRALKYIPMLLSLKNITCILSLQNHRMKFQESFKMVNLIETITAKLDLALKDEMLSTDYKKIVLEVLQILESYKIYSESILKKHNVHILRKNSESDVPANNNINNNERKHVWLKNNKQNTTTVVKEKDEGNWRTLKPDSNVNANVFSRCFQRPITNNSIDVQALWFNSKK